MHNNIDRWRKTEWRKKWRHFWPKKKRSSLQRRNYIFQLNGPNLYICWSTGQGNALKIKVLRPLPHISDCLFSQILVEICSNQNFYFFSFSSSETWKNVFEELENNNYFTPCFPNVSENMFEDQIIKKSSLRDWDCLEMYLNVYNWGTKLI